MSPRTTLITQMSFYFVCTICVLCVICGHIYQCLKYRYFIKMLQPHKHNKMHNLRKYRFEPETVHCFTEKQLARISHQAASNTDAALALWSKARMIKDTVCHSSMPITVQTGLRVRKLALHSNRSHCYAFRSRAALANTNPAPAPVILVRNAG